ncbi:MAG: hypothetical protein E6I90_10015 [Chloroflexi bacterium]|nr:MAG: hypothetical protein E6I90_10015 [Chloroflexota bacterium]
MTHRQIHPFDKRRVQPSREASPLQDDLEIAWCPEAHHVRDPNQPAPLIAFFHLAIDQARRHLPLLHLPSSTTHLEPLTEVSRQRIEVEVEPITGEKRQTVRDQALSQNVDDRMRHVLRAGTQLEHRQNLGAGIDDQPQPQNLLGAAQPGAQLVQLEVREMQMAEDALVQGVRVPACSSEPSRHRGLSKAKDPLCGGKVEPFGQSREHHGDLLRGRFQAIQGGVASSAQRGAARLTAKGLDLLGTAMLAIADQRVDLGIGDAKVPALRVGTGVALRVDAFGSPSATFHFTPGTHRCRH